MNLNDKDFIKHVIQDELSYIHNPGFTSETIKKIKESGNTGHNYGIDSNFIYPVFTYAIIFIIKSILKVLNLVIFHNSFSLFNDTEKIISELLFNPITISICISVLILYSLESYLKKLSSRYY